MRCYEIFSLGNEDAIITNNLQESIGIMEEAFKSGKVLYLKLWELTQEEFDALEDVL